MVRLPIPAHRYTRVFPCCCCCCPSHKHRFQKRINNMLMPVEVDPSDKSMSAKMKRIRNAAVKGMAHDIHADIKDDIPLQVRDVSVLTGPFKTLRGCVCGKGFEHDTHADIKDDIPLQVGG